MVVGSLTHTRAVPVEGFMYRSNGPLDGGELTLSTTIFLHGTFAFNLTENIYIFLVN